MDDRANTFAIRAGDDSDAQAIASALATDVAGFGSRDERPLTVVARDPDGRLLGGLNAASHWRWLYIRHFWVASEARRGGLGRQLLVAAEDEARARDCVGLYLDTFDPDAEAFYDRCGFSRVGLIEDFPPGHARRFLRKKL